MPVVLSWLAAALDRRPAPPRGSSAPSWRGAASGGPWQDVYGEGFNEKLRDECLNLELFASRREAAVAVEAGRRLYNTPRLHGSLGDRTPQEFRDGIEPGREHTPRWASDPRFALSHATRECT